MEPIVTSRSSPRRPGPSSWDDHSVAYEEDLAGRVRALVGERGGLAEKKMFGGLAFLLDGNMAVGVRGDDVIVRLPPDESDVALAEPGARVFDITGRPMKGWILVGPEGQEPRRLSGWVERGLAYASTLPPK
jgi:hypothetical protein